MLVYVSFGKGNNRGLDQSVLASVRSLETCLNVCVCQFWKGEEQSDKLVCVSTSCGTGSLSKCLCMLVLEGIGREG